MKTAMIVAFLIAIVLIVTGVSAVVLFMASNTVDETTTVSGTAVTLSITNWHTNVVRGAHYNEKITITANEDCYIHLCCDVYSNQVSNNSLQFWSYFDGLWWAHSVSIVNNHLFILFGWFNVTKGQTIDVPMQIMYNVDGVYDFQFYAMGNNGN